MDLDDARARVVGGVSWLAVMRVSSHLQDAVVGSTIKGNSNVDADADTDADDEEVVDTKASLLCG
jgi:hypothetical protein